MLPARRTLTALLVAAAATAWLLALWSAVLVSPRTGPARAAAAATVYLAGSLICHQRPERSFHYNNAQLPVCARCLGLYAGGCFGALAWALLSLTGKARWIERVTMSNIPRLTLAVSALPTLISVALGLAGIWDGTNAVRATLALPIGATVGAAVTAVAAGDLR